MRGLTASRMPQPVSVTEKHTKSSGAAATVGRQRSVPAGTVAEDDACRRSGIASRAFSVRLSIDLFDLRGVGGTNRALRRQPRLEPDARTDQAAQQLGRLFDRGVEVDALHLGFAMAAERQQLARQVGAARHRGLDRIHVRVPGIVGGRAQPHDVGVASHHHQDVAEVVRDAGGEAADDLGLL